MAAIESQILVRIRALVEGLPTVQAFSRELRNLKSGSRSGLGGVTSESKRAGSSLTSLHHIGRQVGLTFYSMGRAGHYLSTVFFALSSGWAAFVAALSAVSIAAVGGLLAFIIKRGVEFNAELEQLRLGFASLIFSFADIKDAQGAVIEGQDRWNKSVELGEALMDQIFIKTFQTNRTVNELASAFQTGLAPALNAGLSLQQALDIITRIVQAADVFKLKSNEINEEVRNLLSGNATRDTRIAVALFGSATAANQAIQKAKEAGKVVELLESKLEGFARAGKLLPKTFEGAFSNLRDLFKRVAGNISLEFKDQLTKGFINVFDRIVDTEKLQAGIFKLRPEFERIFGLIKQIANELAQRIPGALDAIFTKVKQIFDFVESKRADGTLSSIAALLGEISGLIGDIFGQVGNSDIPDAFLATILRGATLVVHLIREIVQGLNVLVAFIKVVVVGVVAGFATLVLGVLGRVIELIVGPNSVSSAMYRWATAAEGYLNKIAQQLRDQFGYLIRLIEAYDKLANRAAKASGKPEVGGSASINDTSSTSDLAKVFGKRGTAAGEDAAKKRLRGEAAAARERTNAERDYTKAIAQTTFESVRADLRRKLEVYSQHYADLRHGINTYYQFKTQLETQDAEEEIAYLENLKLIEKDYLREKLEDIKALDETEKAKADRRFAANERYLERTLEFDAKIAQKNKDIRNNDKDNVRERDLAWKQFGRTVTDVLADIAESEDRTAEAAAMLIENQFDDILKQFRLNFGETASLTKALEAYIVKLKELAKVQEALNRFDRLSRTRDLDAAKVQDAFNRGKITQIEYERELNRLSDQYYEKQRAILTAALSVAEATGASADEILRIREALQALDAARVVLDSLAESINATLRDGFNSALDFVLDDITKIGENFKQLALSMIRDIARVILKATILSTLFKALGISEGSKDGLGGILSGLFGGAAKKKDGGILRGPGTSTSDSIPILASSGEAVIAARTVRRYPAVINSLINGTFLRGFTPPGFASGGFLTPALAGASGAALPPKVVVALDDDDISNAMMSSQGEKVWLHYAAKHRRKF